ncbi:proton-coupled zinc antiporter SLC30A1-like [Babylonia areolata]|uniref:proton-coupled zinc antiporter SLC30A1-like n=1 Tax=Babylonia areolata TaxID=304850 RepID=UPI003FD091F1
MRRYSGKTCRLLLMLLLTLAFFLLAVGTGYWSNSLTVVTESFHVLSDAIAVTVALASVKVAKRTSTKNTFGWVRVEIVGTLVNAVFLLALCFTVLVKSLKRMMLVEEVARPLLLLAVGGAGLVVNLTGLLLFHTHAQPASRAPTGRAGSQARPLCEGEGGGGGEDREMQTVTTARDTGSCTVSSTTATVLQLDHSPAPRPRSSAQMNTMGIFLHVLGDALGSVLVIVSSLVVWKAEGQWRHYVDPSLSIIMIIIILFTTLPVVKETSMILMQTIPKALDLDRLKQKVQEVEGVAGLHECHVWQLSDSQVELTMHVLCHGPAHFPHIWDKVRDVLQGEGIHSFTLQPEFVAENCKESEVSQECRLACPLPACVHNTCCGPVSSHSTQTTGGTVKARPKGKNGGAQKHHC